MVGDESDLLSILQKSYSTGRELTEGLENTIGKGGVASSPTKVMARSQLFCLMELPY
jgi:hypothetical protein